MSPDHRFVDAAGGVVDGRQACSAAWASFFASFPDYRNVFESIRVVAPGQVVVSGRSACALAPPNGPARWHVSVADGQVVESGRSPRRAGSRAAGADSDVSAGDAGPVGGGRAEQRAVQRRPLQVGVDAGLPRVADARRAAASPCRRRRRPRRPRTTSPRETATPASGSPAATARPRRRRARGRREIDEHVGARVLHGLERADRAPELLAHDGVGDGGVEHRAAPSPRLSHAIASAPRSTARRARGRPRTATPIARLTATPSAATVPKRRVASRTGCGVDVEARGRRLATTTTGPPPVVAPRAAGGRHRRASGTNRRGRGAGAPPPCRSTPERRLGRRVLAARRRSATATAKLARRDRRSRSSLVRRRLDEATSAPTPSTAVPRYGARRPRPGPSPRGRPPPRRSVAPAPPCASGTSRPSQPDLGEQRPVGTVGCRRSPAGGSQQVAGDGAQLVVELGEVGHVMDRRFPRQAEAALADDRALDLARAAGDRPLPRADEVEHPGARLPPARERLLQHGRGAAQAADLGAEVGHPLEQLAVEQLHDRRVGRPGACRRRPARPASRHSAAEPGELDLERGEPIRHHRVVDRARAVGRGSRARVDAATGSPRCRAARRARASSCRARR